MLATGGIATAAQARTTDTTIAREVTHQVDRARTFDLPITASHVAVHWRGQRSARVRAEFSRDGVHFGRPRRVELDALAERGSRETYGAVTPAPGVRAVRLRSDRPLARASVLALRDRGPVMRRHGVEPADFSTQAVAEPSVIPRSGWAADESLRFDSQGNEIWPPTFHPTQKLIVHHTAGRNDDPDPAATVRSIYYYHAVTRGWGDIGYNFMVDESGRVYEGRYSRQYAPGEAPTGEDAQGNGVTAGHAYGYNSGTVGIALLGTLTNQDAAPAARQALVDLLAWEADHHGIDPQGSGLFTNPVNGTQATFPNIAGHRDVEATECPGGTFYATLPQIRQEVSNRISGGPPPTVARYRPDGYGIASGSIYSGRGAVSRLYENDGARVEVTAARSAGSYVSEIRPYASITADQRASLEGIGIDYDGNATRATTATTLNIYNFAAGSWEKVDGPRTGVTSDRSFGWSNATSPTHYVSAAGEVRLRIRGAGPQSFRTRADLVRITIEY